MRIKKKHIALLIVVALFCATPIYAQKPLTKPEKPQTQSPTSNKKVSVEKGKTQTTNGEPETIPKYIYNRRILYDAIKDEYDVGDDFDYFSNKLDSEEIRHNVYEAIKDEYNDVGTWDEFNAKTAQPKGR